MQGAPPPNRIQFFRFCICFCQKACVSEVSAPPQREILDPLLATHTGHCNIGSMNLSLKCAFSLLSSVAGSSPQDQLYHWIHQRSWGKDVNHTLFLYQMHILKLYYCGLSIPLCDHIGVMEQIWRGWSLFHICDVNPCESLRLRLVGCCQYDIVTLSLWRPLLLCYMST